VGGFRVANPQGYNAPYAIQVESIRVAVDLGSLFSTKIIIKEILVSGTEVNYELKLNGSSNLTDIKKNINAFAESSAPQEEPAEQTAKTEKTEEAPAAQKQVMIRKLSINGSFLTISSSLLKTDVPLPLPPLEMTDLGEGKSFGETVDEFATKVLDTILTTASKSGLKGIGKSLQEAGKNLGDSVGNLQEVEKTLHDTVKGLFK